MTIHEIAETIDAEEVMTTKLTKAQRAKAKRAVMRELRWQLISAGWVGLNPSVVYMSDPEYPEVQRLLKIALRAVERAK